MKVQYEGITLFYDSIKEAKGGLYTLQKLNMNNDLGLLTLAKELEMEIKFEEKNPWGKGVTLEEMFKQLQFITNAVSLHAALGNSEVYSYLEAAVESLEEYMGEDEGDEE